MRLPVDLSLGEIDDTLLLESDTPYAAPQMASKVVGHCRLLWPAGVVTPVPQVLV